MNRSRSLRSLAVAGLASGLLLALPSSPASAKTGDVIRRGDCSARTDWKLKLKARDGGLETEFEVDSNVNNQLWNVTITDNGVTVFRGSRRTAPPSGSFSVERRIPNRAGTDNVRATAVNPRTGERCVGTASF